MPKYMHEKKKKMPKPKKMPGYGAGQDTRTGEMMPLHQGRGSRRVGAGQDRSNFKSSAPHPGGLSGYAKKGAAD